MSIWVIATGHGTKFEAIKDKHLRMVARCVDDELSAKITEVAGIILHIASWEWRESTKSGKIEEGERLLGHEDEYTESDENEGLDINWEFDYVRWLRNIADTGCDNLTNYLKFETLLESNLVLDRSSQPGREGCEWMFLCARISDEDLLWDLEEADR